MGLVLYRALNQSPDGQGKSKKSKRKSKKPASYTGAYDPSTGLGRGAPGFQTNIQKVSISPGLAARIRAGEDVSAEEVTRDLEQQKLLAQQGRSAGGLGGAADQSKPLPESVDPDWLPAGLTQNRKKRR